MEKIRKLYELKRTVPAFFVPEGVDPLGPIPEGGTDICKGAMCVEIMRVAPAVMGKEDKPTNVLVEAWNRQFGEMWKRAWVNDDDLRFYANWTPLGGLQDSTDKFEGREVGKRLTMSEVNMALDELKYYDEETLKNWDNHYRHLRLYSENASRALEDELLNIKKPKKKKGVISKMASVIKKFLKKEDWLIDKWAMDDEGNLNFNLSIVQEALLRTPDFREKLIELCKKAERESEE